MEKEKVIIIAEDDKGHSLLMTRNLRRAGITNEILTFADGRELLDFLFLRNETLSRDPQTPYLLLLDIRMPGIGGIDVLRQIKADDQLKTLPVVMLSTTDEPDIVAECYRIGCNFYIAKPIDHTEFIDTLGKLAQFIVQPSIKFSVMRAIVILAFILCCLSDASAKPIDSIEAHKAVSGWLKMNDRPFAISSGRQAGKVDVYADANQQPVYYVVNLRPSGFVIVSANDDIEPVVAFSAGGTFDPSPENPLGAMVSRDMALRAAGTKGREHKTKKTVSKWQRLALAADSVVAPMGIVSVSDIRVSPLVQSLWDQEDTCGNYCYNYFTPNNYRCGCVATAMAQLMRFDQYPAAGVGTGSFTFYVNGNSQTANLRGGDGLGGPYVWDQMPLVPDCSTTIAQCQAIGALCFDAGVAVHTNYGFGVSTASVKDAKNALVSTFQYSSAAYGFNNGNDIGEGLLAMINPNLDAGRPVILCIGNDAHAVVADGYAYDMTTLYHHINMGHSGSYDAWYNLPDVNPYDMVHGCIYNIFITGSDEIISGRIVSGGSAVEGASITAQADGMPVYTAVTNSIGIYALPNVPSNKTFTVSAEKIGLVFASRIVTTGDSADDRATCGNVWGVNFADNSSPVTIYQTDFSGGLPSGWQIVDGFADAMTWTWTNPNGWSSQYWTGTFMIADSVIFGRVPLDEQLITGSIDCSAFEQICLGFSHEFLQYSNEIADVDVSADGGEWLNAAHYQYSPAQGLVRLDISALANRCADVRIRWRYHNAYYDWYWGIDDVVITGIPWAGLIAGDFGYDGRVDLADFVVLSAAWMSCSGQDNWNPHCDISSPADDAVDMFDLIIFTDNWLQGM